MANGGIKKLKILNKGLYLQFPEKINDLKGGKGNNAVIHIESNLIKERKMIERQIISAQIKIVIQF
jgi:hypothetical protein